VTLAWDQIVWSILLTIAITWPLTILHVASYLVAAAQVHRVVRREGLGRLVFTRPLILLIRGAAVPGLQRPYLGIMLF
jgi:hypothetical protein